MGMIDREKIIQGLEFTKTMITFNPSTGENIEPENLNELDKTSYDACVGAIALLKEREPVKPILEQDSMVCGNCGHEVIWQKMIGDNILVEEQLNYCPQCGKAVKWE